jgi:hypothetical protein
MVRGVVGSLVVAVGMTVVTSATVLPARGDFEMEWTSFARAARWEGEQIVTTGGELSGHGVARLVATDTRSVVRLVFSGEEGAGSGLIGPNGPMAFEFPTAVAVGVPPPVPHLSGGTFEVSGDPRRPEGFAVSYVEGFICRATPAACGGVSMWERRFEARARRKR